MGRQPGQDGNRSAAPDPLRDPRIAGFQKGGAWDGCSPSAELAAALEGVSGPEWRCPEASRDEMLGMLRHAAALESWAAAIKLGVLRALVRDDDEPLPGGGYHGDLPEGWTKSLTHEVALALAVPAVSADKMMWVAWDLEARLPGIGALLTGGELTYAKAKAVHEAFLLLSDQDAARAEALILPELPGKTYGQVKRLAEQAAITVDPEAAARRRAHAERDNARVTLFREDSGAVGLSGRDLPTDQALAAHAHVCARAQQYKDSGAFPDDTGMDQFRSAAYLDLLNGKSAEARIASGQLVTFTGSTDTDLTSTDETAAQRYSSSQEQGEAGPGVTPSTEGCPGRDNPASGEHGHSGSDDPGDGEPGDAANGSRPSGGPPSSPASPGDDRPGQERSPRPLDLVLPLATLLGLAVGDLAIPQL